MNTLHITNGDSAADKIKRSAFVGDVLPWRDPMHHGPFPAGKDLATQSEVRATYLAGDALDPHAVEQDFQRRDAHLMAAADYDHVVLWFEHDLLDQLQLLQILDCLADVDFGATTLDLICINRFPEFEGFRGIGQLDPGQVASLFPGRQPVLAKTYAVAKTGWAAFCSDDPNALFNFANNEMAGLPFLRTALLHHFEDYPDATTGLTRTESQLLRLAQDAPIGPTDLFIRNMDLETALYIGDRLTFRIIQGLFDASLMTCQTGPFWHPPRSADDQQAFGDQRLVLTDQGQRVLSGQTNAFGLIKRDTWLGGVHLSSEQPMWTWDATAHQFSKRGA